MSAAPVACLLLALAGCGELASTAAEAEPTASAIAEPAEAAEREAPTQAAPPSFDDRELDRMDEPALQAACFAGSMAACDRLDIARCDRPLRSSEAP